MSKPGLFIVVIGLLYSKSIYGQGIGIGFAYATSKSLDMEIIYSKNSNNFKLGATLQFTDTRGKQVDVQLPNYGRTIDGEGKYFTLVDLGYGRIIKDKILIDGELSFGTSNHYINYIDNRFNGGGYHLITKTENLFGIGVNAGYMVTEDICLFTGFNSLRKLQFGIRWMIYNSR